MHYYNLVRNSIILAVHKEKMNPRFWDSILLQLKEDDELLIACSESITNTEITKEKNVKFIYNPHQFTPQGLNLCLEQASGKFITLVGFRSILLDNYIDRAIEILNTNHHIGCVGGRIEHTGTTPIGKCIANAMGAPLGMGLFSFRSKKQSGYTDSVSTPVFRSDIVKIVGQFDESLVRNQDDDYSYRVHKLGYGIWLEASIASIYSVREKFSQLSAQFFQYGFWKNYVNKKYQTITTIRQLLPPAFILAQLTLLFVSPILCSLLVGTYFMVLILQSLLINRFNPKYSLLTLYAFVVMHYSYGIGYLCGFVYAFVIKKTPPDMMKKITR
jgi:GT2 family glycosyltransferase